MEIKEEYQKSYQNIQKNIDTETIIIYGKMRNGKTMLAVCLSQDIRRNKRIYSNVSIYKNWKKINHDIKNYYDLAKINMSFTPWIVIIDEAGINVNSKDWRKKENRSMQDFLFLVWKKNCSIIWIAQRFESIDINARVLADYIFECKKLNYEVPKFIITKKKQILWRTWLDYQQQFDFDMISFLKNSNITYNTLEESKISEYQKAEAEEK